MGKLKQESSKLKVQLKKREKAKPSGPSSDAEPKLKRGMFGFIGKIFDLDTYAAIANSGSDIGSATNGADMTVAKTTANGEELTRNGVIGDVAADGKAKDAAPATLVEDAAVESNGLEQTIGASSNGFETSKEATKEVDMLNVATD